VGYACVSSNLTGVDAFYLWSNAKKSAGDAESRVGLLSSVKIFGFGARGIVEGRRDRTSFCKGELIN
jgi:hypothetical protein